MGGDQAFADGVAGARELATEGTATYARSGASQEDLRSAFS